MKKYKIRDFHYYKLITGLLAVVFGVCSFATFLIDAIGVFPWALMMFIISLSFFLSEYIYEQRRYFITDDSIILTFCGIRYKRIMYSEWPVVIISNAVIYGTGMLFPLRDRARTKELGYTVSYPCFIPCTNSFPLHKVTAGMDASHVRGCNDLQSIYIGVCWKEALAELQKIDEVKIYVQRDVYNNYPELFQNHCADLTVLS